MRLYMLYETRLGPIPTEIRIIICYPNTRISCNNGADYANGDTVVLDGPAEAFVRWLRPFDYFWKGIGQPFEERFEQAHIPIPKE